jgi:hypothetical protein
MRTKYWALAMGAVAVALVSVPGAQAATRTIGPIRANSGLTCYVTGSVVDSTAPDTGLPDVTFGSSWSCSGGTKGLGGYSELWGTLKERIAGQSTTRSKTNSSNYQCPNYPNQCSRSDHFQSLPEATYTLTAQPGLRSYFTMNGNNSDDDYWVSWPSMCTGYQLFVWTIPVPQLVRCEFTVEHHVSVP